MINIEQNYEQKARITEASHIDPFCQVFVFLFLQLKLYNFNLDSEPHFINRYPLGNQKFSSQSFDDWKLYLDLFKTFLIQKWLDFLIIINASFSKLDVLCLNR